MTTAEEKLNTLITTYDKLENVNSKCEKNIKKYN